MSAEIKGTLTPESSKCKPISKSLLTPCRRPGLSRKIKTPLNAIQKQDYSAILNTPEHDKSSNISSVLSPLTLNTTTKETTTKNAVKSCLKETAFKKTGKIDTKSQDISYTDTILKKPQDELKPKADANKIITSQSQFNSDKTALRKSKSIDTNLKEKSNHNASQEHTGSIEEKTRLKEVSEKKNSKGNSSVSMELKTKISKRIDINKATISDCSSYQSDSSTSSNHSGKANKNKLKRLSMKKISTSQDTITDFKHTSENNLSPISSKEPKTSNGGVTKSQSPTKSKKRLAPSSDEEDAVYPEDEFSKIEEIKKRIKLKELQLDELKRAAIYTKLHNLEDLEELSTTWRIGCKKALTELLNKLQEHGQIEMTTLLKKFNIPESLMNSNDCDY